MWGGACLWFLGNWKCLKQGFYYKINKDRELLQYMYIKIFVFDLPYIQKRTSRRIRHMPKLLRQPNTSTEDILYCTFIFCFKDFVSQWASFWVKYFASNAKMFLEWKYLNAPRYVRCTVATCYWNSQTYPLGSQILIALIWPCWLTVFAIKHSNWSPIVYYNSSNIHCQPIKGLNVWAKQLAPGTCFEHLPDLLNG